MKRSSLQHNLLGPIAALDRDAIGIPNNSTTAEHECDE